MIVPFFFFFLSTQMAKMARMVVASGSRNDFLQGIFAIV